MPVLGLITASNCPLAEGERRGVREMESFTASLRARIKQLQMFRKHPDGGSGAERWGQTGVRPGSNHGQTGSTGSDLGSSARSGWAASSRT